MVLNLAAMFDWDIEGIDVEQAFLESPLDKEIYMTLPKDVYCQSDNPNKPAIVKLLRSLYGLKQAGEHACLIHDSCVFIKRNPDTGKVVIVVVYVDDILFIGNDKDEIQKIVKSYCDDYYGRGDEIYRSGDLTRSCQPYDLTISAAIHRQNCPEQ
jgi:hypothetical protein